MTCSSKVGETTHCAADTSKGVVLARSYGTASCLLGKTWGYDDQGVWVSDGCIADFLVAGTAAAAQAPATTKKAPRYVPNGGFLIVEDELGEVYVRLFSYARYLNQLGLDETYTDAFGKVHTVQRRQDAQLQKFFLPFSGWFLTPNFRYYLYVWSANTSQGDAAQVVGGGNISYVFNKYVTFGGGITSLPSVRSTEGQFPYWLGVDDRLIADEFFRGSYTTGFSMKGGKSRPTTSTQSCRSAGGSDRAKRSASDIPEALRQGGAHRSRLDAGKRPQLLGRSRLLRRRPRS